MTIRHPVVLTTLQEDMEKIGLAQEGQAGTGDPGKNYPMDKGGGGKFAAKGSTTSTGESQMGSNKLPPAPYKVGGDKLHPQSASRKSKAIDYAENDEGMTEEEALAEAVAFSEEFDEEFEALGPEADVYLTDEEMDELDQIGESVELPGGIIDEDEAEEEDDLEEEDDDEEADEVDEAEADEEEEEEETEDEDVEEDEDEEEDDESLDEMKFARQKRGGAKKAAHREYAKWKRRNPAEAKKKSRKAAKWAKTHKARVARMRKTAKKGFRREDVNSDSISAMLNELGDRVSHLSQGIDIESPDTSIPAFANIALIAEMLHDVFKADDEEALAEGYAELAKHAAGIVEFLESGEEADLDAVEAQFDSFMEALLPGLDAFSAVMEGLEEEEEVEEVEEEDEESSEDKPEDEGEEKEEGKEKEGENAGK